MWTILGTNILIRADVPLSNKQTNKQTDESQYHLNRFHCILKYMPFLVRIIESVSMDTM